MTPALPYLPPPPPLTHLAPSSPTGAGAQGQGRQSSCQTAGTPSSSSPRPRSPPPTDPPPARSSSSLHSSAAAAEGLQEVHADPPHPHLRHLHPPLLLLPAPVSHVPHPGPRMGRVRVRRAIQLDPERLLPLRLQHPHTRREPHPQMGERAGKALVVEVKHEMQLQHAHDRSPLAPALLPHIQQNRIPHSLLRQQPSKCRVQERRSCPVAADEALLQLPGEAGGREFVHLEDPAQPLHRLSVPSHAHRRVLLLHSGMAAEEEERRSSCLPPLHIHVLSLHHSARADQESQAGMCPPLPPELPLEVRHHTGVSREEERL
eukprot:765362-Hanusia_phi.AAC.2